MIKVICSRCKCDSEPVKDGYTPENWERLTFSGRYRAYMIYPLCPKCKNYLKLPDHINASENIDSVGERLIELLEEIALNVVEDNK